ERLTHAVPAIGCTIALTTRRLFVIRDGSAFRPKTGVREWPLETSLDVKPGLVRHGSGSLVIRQGRDVTSVFVSTEEWAAALQLTIGTAVAGVVATVGLASVAAASNAGSSTASGVTTAAVTGSTSGSSTTTTATTTPTPATATATATPTAPTTTLGNAHVSTG